jgi:TrpR-related protein YerC/YecD
MSKVKTYSVAKKEKDKITDGLFEAISGLKSKKEVFAFMLGLLTESEILMIGRRIQIAKLLADGESFNNIREKLKASFLTISKVEKWVNEENKNDLIIDKIGKRKETKSKNSGYIPGSLLNKYRHHRTIRKIFK